MTPNTKLRAAAVMTAVLMDLSDRKGFDAILNEIGWPSDSWLGDELEEVIANVLENFEGQP